MYLNGLSAFIQRRWGSWGILILSLLALVLAVWCFSNILLLSAIVSSGSETNASQAQIWAVFAINALLGAMLAASAYGLWGRRNWGRLLFIVCIIIWAAFHTIALFIPGAWSDNFGIGALILNLIPLVAVVTAILYLNLAHIKILFDTPPNQLSE